VPEPQRLITARHIVAGCPETFPTQGSPETIWQGTKTKKPRKLRARASPARERVLSNCRVRQQASWTCRGNV